MTSSPHAAREGSKARRQVGKTTALLLTAALIVGTGLFNSLGAATAEAGSGILVAMLIGGLIALLTGISAAQVGVNYPDEGGAFIWLRRFGYPALSFVAGCSYLFKGILGAGVLPLVEAIVVDTEDVQMPRAAAQLRLLDSAQHIPGFMDKMVVKVLGLPGQVRRVQMPPEVARRP